MRDAQAVPTEIEPPGSRIRGTQLTYWPDNINHCPGCGKTSWIIGRFSAECSLCRTALALAHSGMLGVGTPARNHRFERRYFS